MSGSESSIFETIRPAKKAKEGEPVWLIAYLDLAQNLMALFLLMLSMSKIDVQKFDAVSNEMSKQTTKQKVDSLEDLKKKVDTEIQKQGLQKSVATSLGFTGLQIEFLGGVLFESGSAELSSFANNEATPILDIVRSVDTKYYLSFEGHTDDVPIKTPRFPDNWALSSARGSALLTSMERMGVQESRMSVAGYGNSRPKIPLRDAKGLPLTGKDLDTARAANRRVVIRVYQ